MDIQTQTLPEDGPETLNVSDVDIEKLKQEAQHTDSHCPKCGLDATNKDNVVLHQSERKIRFPGSKKAFHGVTAFCKCGHSYGFAGLVPDLHEAYTPAKNAKEKRLKKRKASKLARKRNR